MRARASTTCNQLTMSPSRPMAGPWPWPGETGPGSGKLPAGNCHDMIVPTPVYCLAYSRDGRYLAMGTEEFSYTAPPGEIILWDTESGRNRLVLQAKMSRVRSLAFAPDGRAVVAATREGVFLWELLNHSLARAVASGGGATEPGNGHYGRVWPAGG